MRIKPDECEAIGYIVLREDGTTQQLLTRLEEHLLALQEDLSRLEERVDRISALPDSLAELRAKIEQLAITNQDVSHTAFNRLAEMNSQLAHLSSSITMLSKEFRERDQLMARLLEEREQLKTNWLYEEYLQPAATKLMDLRGALLKVLPELSDNNARNLLKVIDQGLTRILNGWGIEEKWDSPKRFEPAFQKAVVMPTLTPDEHGVVLRVVEPAYYRNGNLIREQVVVVAQYQAQKEGSYV
jgi:molecular chaperone GrpE (heat shock protein)